MIPILQTKFSIKNKQGVQMQWGNCMAAALASFFEVPITDVPNIEVFYDFPGNFDDTVWSKWIKLKGYEWVRVPCRRPNSNDYYFVVGKSDRGVHHMCIYKNGLLVHDPHPSGDGLISTEEFYYLDLIIEP